MKNLYKIKLILLAFLVVSMGFITSCGDDDESAANGGEVQLLSFGPTGAKHGEEIRFIGYNLNKVESIEMRGATINKAQFVEHTSELIRLVVPQEAMEGKVTLKVSGGDDVVSKTDLSFEVPITITSMTAQAKPGTNITITGTKLNWVEGVVFERDTVKTFVSQSATEVVLQVPMTAKTGKLVIVGGGTEPSFIETERELIVAVPSVTGLTQGTLNNGSNLTITGTNLDLVKEVRFTGVGAAVATSFVSQSATQLVVRIPANAIKGRLTLVAYSGVEVPTTQEVTLTLPAVTDLSPASVLHEENLTITGTNLDLVKEIEFTGVGAAKVTTFVTKEAGRIVVKVPANASRGTLKLVANSGAVVTTTQTLNITLPTITSMTPSPVDPGQNLTINGTNLDLVKSIEFQGGTVVTTFVSQTPTRIVVTVPMNAKRGALKVTTHKNYVVDTGAQISVVLPALTSVTPEPVVVGNYLTLSGTELNLVKSVVFTGGATVSDFVAKNDNQIVLVVPATAKTGVLKLITTSNFEVTTDKQAQIGTAVPNISSYIYENSLSSAWEKWNGWDTSVQDLASTEQKSRGASSIKVTYTGAYGALQLHPKSTNPFAGFSHVVLYVYSATGDYKMALQVGSGPDAEFNVKKDVWTKVEIPISQLGDVSNVTQFMIKNFGTAPHTVYIDDLGLR